MAAKNGNGNFHLPAFMKDQLTEAQKRLAVFETDAEKMLKTLAERGREGRKEIEGLLQKLSQNELLENPTVKAFGKKANQASHEVRRRLDDIQNRVVEAVGVASQSQIKELNRELGKLAKKVDALVGKKGKTPDAHA